MSRPRPNPDQVLVHVHAARANAGFSGVVVEVGRDVASVRAGEAVFGTGPGCPPEAELVLCRASSLSRKPARLLHREAAALPLPGTVALRAIRLAGARHGDRVLIAGASTSTGSLALQIAKAGGNQVTGACPDRDVPLVWELGADHVYAPERSPEGSTRFAAIIDTNDSVTPDQAQDLLQPDGRFVAVRADAIHVYTASGTPVVVRAVSPPEENDLVDLAELVEHDCLFPLHERS